MKAIKIDGEWWADQLEADARDRYTRDQHKRVLELVERRHQHSVAAGGMEATLANGPSYVKYPLGSEGKRLRERDREAVRIHVTTFGQNLHTFFGPRRSGKTLLSGIAAKRWYEYGGGLFTNVGFGFGHRLAGAVDLLALRRSPPWTWWMVDEAHQALSKFRQGSRYQRSFVGALAAMGKQQACCSLISSQEWAFGMDVKAEVKWNCYPRRRNVTGEAGVYLPQFLGTYGHLVGPRPWRGRTMADDYKIPLEAPIREMLWYPSMAEIEETACCYGSYVGIPSVKESGGHIMASDMKGVDEDEVIDFEDSVDLDDEEQDAPLTMESYNAMMQETSASISEIVLAAPWLDSVLARRGSQINVNLALACTMMQRDGHAIYVEHAERALGRTLGSASAKFPPLDALQLLARTAESPAHVVSGSSG